MQIIDVTASTHEVPNDVPLLDDVRLLHVVLVRVETDEGITGYGRVNGAYWGFAIREFIERKVAPLVDGANPIETEGIWDLLQTELNQRVQTGVWSSAVSAVDIALWDIKGKFWDTPVWRLLGGATASVPVYVTFGLKEYDREQLATLAEDVVSEGFRGVKMLVGVNDSTDPAEDADRVRAVREAVGDGVDLMIDGNYEFAPDRALELCNRVEGYDVAWFEEPVYGNDSRLLAKLSDRTRIPIAAGQMEGHRFRHRAMIEANAIDISQPNVCFVGGFTEAIKAASVAQTYNLDMAHAGGWPYQNMHLQAGMANGRWVELHHGRWREDIYEDPPTPDRGVIELPETPGLGLSPDRDVLDEYRVR